MEKSQRNFSRKCLMTFPFALISLHLQLFLSQLSRLCLTVLRHKGNQVEKQREEIEMLGMWEKEIKLPRFFNLLSISVSSDIDLKSTLEQMEKQKKQIVKFEAERVQYKTRIKELTDEMAMMHGRELQGSDEDSPDQLSEIDRQQELMSNISMKNKHIKRLLRDIEVRLMTGGSFWEHN